ncbi:MAG: hypothetical protein D6674_00215 [Acidobacteria bacterium]|nr:MAG: hypothetical protein D6674_00215 [Acidobacteriota bacterium]
MKAIKEAFEDYYKGIRTPQGMDYRVLLKIERSRRKRLILFAGLESTLLLLLFSILIYERVKPAEYEPFSLRGVPVSISKDLRVGDMSKMLRDRGITLEGPYDEGLFYLKGDEEEIERLIREGKVFKRLDGR